VLTWTSAALTERLGGDETLARELVDIFLAEYPTFLQSIRDSVDGGDPLAIRRSAHALKGSIVNFVDEGPTLTAFALERAAAESRLDDIPALVARLEGEVENLVAAMRRFRGEDRCAF
jgi:HPt (histidine-containing phosphotransfer) domain-containing protein